MKDCTDFYYKINNYYIDKTNSLGLVQRHYIEFLKTTGRKIALIGIAVAIAPHLIENILPLVQNQLKNKFAEGS